MGECLVSCVDVTAILRWGVYVLSYQGKVVFVGKSKCPIVQIAAHRSLAHKRMPEWVTFKGVVFDCVEIFPSHPDRIDTLYADLVTALNPPAHPKPQAQAPPHLNLPIRPL